MYLNQISEVLAGFAATLKLCQFSRFSAQLIENISVAHTECRHRSSDSVSGILHRKALGYNAGSDNWCYCFWNNLHLINSYPIKNFSNLSPVIHTQEQ